MTVGFYLTRITDSLRLAARTIMNTRRDFLQQLAGIGLFGILPGAGRVWRAERTMWVYSVVDQPRIVEGMAEVMREMGLPARIRKHVNPWVPSDPRMAVDTLCTERQLFRLDGSGGCLHEDHRILLRDMERIIQRV